MGLPLLGKIDFHYVSEIKSILVIVENVKCNALWLLGLLCKIAMYQFTIVELVLKPFVFRQD